MPKFVCRKFVTINCRICPNTVTTRPIHTERRDFPDRPFHLTNAVGTWKKQASDLGIARTEQEVMAAAFEA
jgi:hypothetical protein